MMKKLGRRSGVQNILKNDIERERGRASATTMVQSEIEIERELHRSCVQ